MLDQLPEWIPQTPGVAEIAHHMNQIVRKVNGDGFIAGGAGARSAALRGVGQAISATPDTRTRSALCQVTGNSGYGQYTGRIFGGDLSATPGQAAVSPMGLVDPGSDDCIVVNLGEVNAQVNGGAATGNALAVGQWVVGERCGYATGTSGQALAIVAVNMPAVTGPFVYTAVTTQLGGAPVTPGTPTKVCSILPGAMPGWTGNRNVLAIATCQYQAQMTNANGSPTILTGDCYTDWSAGPTNSEMCQSPLSIGNNGWSGSMTIAQIIQGPVQEIDVYALYSTQGTGVTTTGVQAKGCIYVIGG